VPKPSNRKAPRRPDPLVGVGPKLAASLADLGVTKFSQIAAWTPDELSSYDQLLNLKGRADRDAWIAQAKRFSEV
jgi:predicted flap endonuclease-1-like 5' DNA nuclease